MNKEMLEQLQQDVTKSADALRISIEVLEGYDSTKRFTEDLERIYWELSGFMFALSAFGGHPND